MTCLWTSDDIATAVKGKAHGPFSVSGVEIDSRHVTPGDLFFALHGQNMDGHAFIPKAVANGAAGCVVEHLVNSPHIQVENSLHALQDLGRAARMRCAGRIIGITGSVGKTSVKDAIHQALQRCAPGHVHASARSFNNHTGLPLSLAQMPQNTRFGIFEMGMNHPEEIRFLTRICQPHIAVITWIAAAHIAYFKDEDAIAHAKAEIFDGVVPAGHAVIPADSPQAPILIAAAKARNLNITLFGQDADKKPDARLIACTPDAQGSEIQADIMGQHITCRIGIAGRHWVHNALAVLASVALAGGDLGQAGLALSTLRALPGRGRILSSYLDDGGEALIIDESYNANPASMRAALETLGGITPARQGRRIVVLGDMKELGARSAMLHEGLVDPIMASGVAHAILVGPEIAPLADRLKGRVACEHVPDAQSAQARLLALLRADDVVLIKGSNSMGLGTIPSHLHQTSKASTMPLQEHA